eukprot:TRINITY_DN113798_c0_g1_i1.p1 TRINITY_DN113798_c0_g1~~TRINITY_DN113798_c0_g1_i1.p1  ORF type:complete len:425 (+),score=100.14 TRINITY_DN113798_c0_g1_i1:99-1373(+)
MGPVGDSDKCESMDVRTYDVAGKQLSPQDLLALVYADEFGKTGHDLAGHAVGEADVATLVENGSSGSLLYGELLPDGVARLEKALFAERPRAEASASSAAELVLELGMGTGKVALQMFLAAARRDVYGVELSTSRYALAEEAFKRLSEVAPATFRYEQVSEGAARIVNQLDGCKCDIVLGSLLDTPRELIATAVAVVMEVCLPKEAQKQACAMLQHCATGCRVVCYAPLHDCLDSCRLAPVRLSSHADADASCLLEHGDGAGGLSLAASWKPHGHGFAFYEVAETSDAAAAIWSTLAAAEGGNRIKLDATGNPCMGRRFRYTDQVFAPPSAKCAWAKGDKVMVGYSWLPFPDLGDPDDEPDENSTGISAVHWSAAWVVAVDEDGYTTLCNEEGIVEEGVHPDRIRKPGCKVKREKFVALSEDES